MRGIAFSWSYIDAEAIAEVVGRPTIRFVPVKSDDQLDIQSLHRVRDRWVMRRTQIGDYCLLPTDVVEEERDATRKSHQMRAQIRSRGLAIPMVRQRS